MARTYKVGKTWYTDFKYGEYRNRRSLGVTTKQAPEADRLKIELASIQVIYPLKGGRTCLEELFEQYLFYSKKRNTTNTEKYKATHLARFARFFGNECLKTITRADVESYVSWRVGGAGTPTINRELTTLKHFFNFNLDRGLVESNPCREVKRLAEKKRPLNILSDEGLRHYFDYCQRTEPPRFYRAAFYNTATAPFFREGERFSYRTLKTL